MNSVPKNYFSWKNSNQIKKITTTQTQTHTQTDRQEKKRQMTSPKVFPGNLCEANIGAISWCKNFVAYGCQCYVVIVNASTLEIVQTLDEHHFPITSVKWSPQFHTAPINQSTLVLASADTSGTIFIWNGLYKKNTSFIK